MTDSPATSALRVPFIMLEHAAGLEPPRLETAGAAGADLRAAVPEDEPISLPPLKRALVPTGIAIGLPGGFEAQVRPRSGLAARHGITVLNSPGTIDADYRGEIKVILVNLSDEPFVVTRGMRVAQLVVASIVSPEFCHVSGLNTTSRDDGGFGSTGLD